MTEEQEQMAALAAQHAQTSKELEAAKAELQQLREACANLEAAVRALSRLCR